MRATYFPIRLAAFTRKIGASLALFALLASPILLPSHAQLAPNAAIAQALPGELIVKFRENATDAQLAHAMRQGNLKVRRHIQTQAMRDRGHNGLTHVSTGLRTEDALAQLKNHPAVEYAEQRVTQEGRGKLPAESSIASMLRERYGLERETAMEVFRAAVDRIERRRSGATAYLTSNPRRKAGKLWLLLTWLKTCCGARTTLVAK